jgi:hypothetical protein
MSLEYSVMPQLHVTLLGDIFNCQLMHQSAAAAAAAAAFSSRVNSDRCRAVSMVRTPLVKAGNLQLKYDYELLHLSSSSRLLYRDAFVFQL